MYGSASTWLFNVVREIYRSAGEESVNSHFLSGTFDFRALDQEDVIHLVKSHEISDENTVAALAGRSNKIFITMRDPRDAVASLMLYHAHDFEKALNLVAQSARLCVGFMKDKRAVVLRYDSRFFEDPRIVHNIANDLGFALPDAIAIAIFDGLSRTNVEKYIASFPAHKDILQDPISGDLLDPKTQWHTHHAGRTGETGRWKTNLTGLEIRTIKERFHDIQTLM
jgi:hypothetical protein